MARPVSTDFLQNSKFQVDVIAADGIPRLQRPVATGSGLLPQAGFSKVTVPKITVSVAQYSEGTFIYPRKFPGIPTLNNITMSRGITRGDTTFWDWLRQVIEGSGEYRAEVTISKFHRDTAYTRGFPATGTVNLPHIDTTAKAARIYHVYEAFIVDHEVDSEQDATSDQISVQSLEIAYESFEIENPV